jgi:hypothetical protein
MSEAWRYEMDNEKKEHLKEKAKEEFRLLLLITAYLTAFFVAFLTYRRLISREFGVTSFHYGFAVIEALIIAKVILIGKAIGLGKEPTRGALALGVLRKSVLYAGLVAVFSVLEHVIEGLIHGKSLAVSVDDMLKQGIYEILGKTLVIFVAFIPFFGIWELDRVLGERKLLNLFFRKAPQTAG